MKQHVFNIENSDIPIILSEFSITTEQIPTIIISALCGDRPQINHLAFKAYITPDLKVQLGNTRRFRRLEAALQMIFAMWIDK